MKHYAKIQVEFLNKLAARWEDLPLEFQKAYLNRHPKSKRRLTARPSAYQPLQRLMQGEEAKPVIEKGTSSSGVGYLDLHSIPVKAGSIVQDYSGRNLEVSDVRFGKPFEMTEGELTPLEHNVIIRSWWVKTTDGDVWRYGDDGVMLSTEDEPSSTRAERKMRKGNIISCNMTPGPKRKYFKLDKDGQLWSSADANDWVIERGALPDKKFRVDGQQVQDISLTSNHYYKITEPVKAWLPTGEHAVEGYYGSAAILKTLYRPTELPKGTKVQQLVGGTFILDSNNQRVPVRFTDPKYDLGVFQKQYGFDATIKHLPLGALAETTEQGKILRKPPVFPPMKQPQPTSIPIVPALTTPTPTRAIKPVTAEGEPLTKTEVHKLKFPKEQIASSLQRLPFINSGWMHDDEATVESDQDGNFEYADIGIRDLGNWIDRPGEEDDDYPTWSEESRKKYEKLYKDWLTTQPWYDSNEMEPTVHSGEKSWAYFGIRKK